MKHRFTAWLVVMSLALAAGDGVAQGQLPGGFRPGPPAPGTDPEVAPPLPTVNPKPVPAAPPQVTQPGIILKERPIAGNRPVFLEPGEPPGQVRVTATGSTSATLSWQPPADAIHYWIHLAGPGETTFHRGTSAVTEPTATVHHLLPGNTYSIRVSAIYPPELNRREGFSPPVSATTTGAPDPTGLAASVVARGRVNLTWDKLPGVDGLRLFRNGAMIVELKPVSFNPSSFSQPPPPTLPTTFADSVPVGTHRYQIQAVYRTGGVEAVSALAPAQPVSVTIAPSSRVRFCQVARRTSP